MAPPIEQTQAAARWLSFYFLAGFAHVFGQLMDLPWLVYASKPLLMPCLLLFFRAATWYHLQARVSNARSVITGALIFAWLGDVFLMFDEFNPIFFLLGLGSFLITHLLYTYAFVYISSGHRRLSTGKFLLAAVVIAYAVAFYTVLKAAIPPQLVMPVGLYTAVISLMVIMAIFTRDALQPPYYRTLIIGVFLFLVSDSLIGLSLPDVPLFSYDPSLLIMPTYILGQYAIIRGLVNHLNHLPAYAPHVR